MSGAVGFYGKLPGAGDFVQRRLPSAFVAGWDRHFQRAVETSRRELGGQWTATYRQGFPWRFVLPAQVCGNGMWCGLIGPAEDRLGRGFPIVLAAPCAGDVASVLGNGAWFDSLEQVYRSAQDEPVSVETFDTRVAALPHPLANAVDAALLWRDLDWNSGQWQLALPASAAAGVLLAETWKQLSLRPGAWCLWWTRGAGRLLATRGLPVSYSALLEPLPSQGAIAVGATDGFAGHSVTHHEPMGEAGVRHLSVSRCGGQARSVALPEHSAALADAALLHLDRGRTLLLCADDGPRDPRRRAALSIRAAALASPPDLASVQTNLLALHARLRATGLDPIEPVPEDAAVLVARFETGQVRLLRIGAAAAWHWRRGRLRPLFVERAAGAGGELDDLLFGAAWLAMPGLGAAETPHCDEASGELEVGDRLLLLATRGLTELSPQIFAEALDLPTCEDARLYIAVRAGLGPESAQWPLTVVGIES